MPQPVLDFPQTGVRERLAGFRLRRLEMFNWGTFHQKVAVLAPEGRWTLVVGENGSGKTTAVDALRTLLVPPRLLQYNDASGDQKRRDRTRRSYVRGAWATSSQEDTATARVEYLRKPGEQTILLAVFSNEVSGAEVTLAQILWEANEKIDDIFAVARGRKAIKEDLSNLGQSPQLKKALRSRGFEPYESFAGYEEIFRSRLGIPGRGALEVFNQAIGVKEIADVNSFIRRHMLEPSQAVDFISSHLQPHYRELDACYQAIQKARAQIEKLDPIAQAHRRMEEAHLRKAELEALQQTSPRYFAHRHLQLRHDEADELQRRLEVLAREQTERAAAQSADDQQRIALELDLASDAVGLRLKALEFEQKDVLKAKREKEETHQGIRRALATMQKPLPFDAPEAFQAMRDQVSANKGLYEGNRDSARAKQLEAGMDQRSALAERNELSAELENLRQQRALIPREFVAVRRAISEATGVSSEELPFAGELLEVKSDYREWTGTIERLLRSFGISLLVPEQHYVAVARIINSRHLGLRLTFHRVPAQARAVRADALRQADRVPARLNFRDHPLQSWVKAEVSQRFDHVCCANVQRLKEVDFGITREGLIRNAADPAHQG